MMMKSRSLVRIVLLSLVLGVAQPSQAMPFDPVPSRFERWLNARRDWPAGQSLTFSGLAQCSDQSQPVSPYRVPTFTCLKGQVRTSGGGKSAQVCRLRRVSYLPKAQQVRLWTTGCRSLP